MPAAAAAVSLPSSLFTSADCDLERLFLDREGRSPECDRERRSSDLDLELRDDDDVLERDLDSEDRERDRFSCALSRVGTGEGERVAEDRDDERDRSFTPDCAADALAAVS